MGREPGAMDDGSLVEADASGGRLQILQMDVQGNRDEKRPADLRLREHVCGLTMMSALWGFPGFLFMCYSKGLHGRFGQKTSKAIELRRDLLIWTWRDRVSDGLTMISVL
nr:uncharacterized protein LOC127333028 isoform X2 [Lolium perenne]